MLTVSLNMVPCGIKFLWVVIFVISAFFFQRSRKNKFLQIKITPKDFPAKIYCKSKYSLHKNTVLRNCIFEARTSLQKRRTENVKQKKQG